MLKKINRTHNINLDKCKYCVYKYRYFFKVFWVKQGNIIKKLKLLKKTNTLYRNSNYFKKLYKLLNKRNPLKNTKIYVGISRLFFKGLEKSLYLKLKLRKRRFRRVNRKKRVYLYKFFSKKKKLNKLLHYKKKVFYRSKNTFVLANNSSKFSDIIYNKDNLRTYNWRYIN